MPCKNAGPFLQDCINSILQQSYAQWELIICDDSSSDQSLTLLQSFEKKHDNIAVIQNTGAGILDALNLAYRQAIGFFVTRMDADDIMPKHKLKTLVKLLQNKSAKKVATGKVQYFPVDQIKEGFKAYEIWINSLVDLNNHWQEIYKECVIASPCWMMDRVSFDQIGGFGSDYPEDYDLVWRMFRNQIEVISSADVLHLWRDHPARTSRNSEVYQTQTYFKLKVNHMLMMPEIQKRQWIVWGAGKKGKSLVKELLAKNITPIWVTNNNNKVGHDIYSIILQEYTILPYNDSKLAILLTVSSLDDQKDVHNFLHSRNYQKSIDYFVLA
jgi:glycosyltransferase involved in cell wall biosynthesis